MKKINVMMVMLVMLFMASFNSVTAQAKGKEYIANFEEGRTLSKADVAFLNSISNGKKDAKDAMVSGSKYAVGQKLTAADATKINSAKADFRKSHKLAKATDAKPIDKSRGNENCYWYLYCDGYGNCYYVWYCD